MTPHERMEAVLATPAVRALVKNRIYDVNEVPQNTAEPYITFQRISHPRTHASTGPSSVSAPIFQVEGWTSSHTQRQALSEAMLGAFDAEGSMALADGGVDEVELATEGNEDHTRVVRFEVTLVVNALT